MMENNKEKTRMSRENLSVLEEFNWDARNMASGIRRLRNAVIGEAWYQDEKKKEEEEERAEREYEELECEIAEIEDLNERSSEHAEAECRRKKEEDGDILPEESYEDAVDDLQARTEASARDIAETSR